MSIANVSIVGNLVKAPEQMQFASGKVKTTMVVAVNTPFREKRGGDSADFYRVETWGRLAELTASRLSKGNQVTANGRLLMEKWTDRQGRERVTPTVSATEVAFPQRPRVVEPYDDDEPIAPLSSRAVSDDDSFDQQPIAAQSSRAAADDDSSDGEDEDDASADDEEESSSSEDDYKKPDNPTRPAPMRERKRSPG